MVASPSSAMNGTSALNGTSSATTPTTTTVVSSSSSCPFDVIVVTCPDERAAQAALDGPLAQLQRLYPHVIMTATCDPLGCRCGSGGGTLAAMDLIPKVETSKSLVLHAGGDSSRAPTQMVLGKAWTTLPSNLNQQQHPDSSSSSSASMNPTVWMLQQLMKRFPNLPPGSVIVAAADTILSLLSQHANNDEHHPDILQHNMMVVPDNVAVLGVAVPAPFATAKNHGVFGLDRMEVMETTSAHGAAAGIYAVEEVWQKPSLQVLPTLRTSHVVTPSAASAVAVTAPREPEAWIDTGIVIFFPQAVKALQHLMNTVLLPCTKRGLEQLYQAHLKESGTLDGHAKNGNQDHHAELCAFAKQHALSVDLYTHLLQAFRDTSPSSTSSSLQSYLRSFSSLPKPVLEKMYQTLSELPLHVMALPQGRFLHLGTTREYMEFLIVNTTATSTTTSVNVNNEEAEDDKLQTPAVVDEHEEPWGFKLGLIRRQGSLVQIPPPTTAAAAATSPTVVVAPTAVMVQSLIHLGHAGSPQQPTHDEAVVHNGRHHDDENGVANGHSHDSNPKYIVGHGTVVEHCCLTLDDSNGDAVTTTSTTVFKVGHDCLLSGLRGTWRSSDAPLIIPDGIMVQMIPLMPAANGSNSTNNTNRRWVYMVLGVDDDIKKFPCPTLYGERTAQVLEKLQVSPSDLWAPEEDTVDGIGIIWKARLHPVVLQTGDKVDLEYASYFGWLEWLLTAPDTDPSPQILESVRRWKEAPRLSLAEIRNQSDALTDFQYRQDLSQQIVPQSIERYWQTIVNILEERQHVPCCFQWVLDEYAANRQLRLAAPHVTDAAAHAVTQLDQVVRRGLAANAANQHWDVCGRTLMVTSALLEDLAAIAMDGHEPSFDGDKPLELPILASMQLNTLSSSQATSAARLEAWDQLVHIRNEWLQKQATTTKTTTSSWMLRNVARTWELAASGMTQLCCNTNSTSSSSAKATPSKPLLNQWTMATAPARIDFSGGWSDTPPICFEHGGSVTGLAVTLDGYKPLSCRCRISTGAVTGDVGDSAGGIWLRAESRNLQNGALLSSAEVSLRRVSDLRDFQNPAATCALIKCALVYFGLIPMEDIFNEDVQDADLQPYLNRFCLGDSGAAAATTEHVRLEIVCTSLLPHGSGLGTSSILGGCILSAIGHCRGLPVAEQDLLQAVLSLEQLLTSGGGYQDQVNGLIGGLKMVSSECGTWPVSLNVDRVELSPSVITELNERLVLAFTGQIRLAKNILQNVLRRWARRTPEIVTTVHALVRGANEARQALQDGNVTDLGRCLSEYWTLKKHMAGKESGVEPSHVRHVLQVLQDEIAGASLCGAGGGGFLVLLAREGGNLRTLQAAAEQAMPHQQDHLPGDDAMPQLTWHACQVSVQGLTTGVLDQVPTNADWDHFDLEWQSPTFGV